MGPCLTLAEIGPLGDCIFLHQCTKDLVNWQECQVLLFCTECVRVPQWGLGYIDRWRAKLANLGQGPAQRPGGVPGG
eukprot:5675338-Lingulodinium_polyedra.AAC.1